MNNTIQHAPRADDTIVIEGILTELQVSPGMQNLFEQIDKHYRGKSVVTGMGAVVGDLYGQAAAAAATAMYEGEYTENFICMIGDNVVCGTFGGASKLPVGKHVKAVVQKKNEIVVAQGIMSESDGLVWLGHAWGANAEKMANLKIAAWCFCFALLCVSLCIIFLGVNIADSKTVTFLEAAAAAAVICFGTAFWSNAAMNALSDPATDVLRKLGFCDPEKVNLNNYRYGIVHGHALLHSNETQANHFNVHCYQNAINDGKIKMCPQNHESRKPD